MYEAYFKLSSKPFDLLPDPRFIYLSASHKKAQTYLDYGIRERSGFILLTGEVGSGKTTLIRNLLDRCYEHIVLSKIFNTRVSSEQLLAMINDDFGLEVQGKDKVALIRDLNDFLIAQYAAGNQPILIIDEAQNLSQDLLEEVRMLSNLEAANSKLLQIILVGQPELRTILSSPELRQLRQRININCHLQALSRAEIELYIIRRLEVAGNAAAVTFEPAAFDAIYRYCRGIPRLINIICDFLLFLAFAEETNVITVEMVSDVIGDLDFENYHWQEGTDAGLVSSAAAEPLLKTSLPQAADQDLQCELDVISKRLATIEQSIAAPLKAALKGQNERIDSFQANVRSEAVKTNAHILELSKKLEELKSSVGSSVRRTEPENSKIGFVRRLFGGGSSPFARK